MFIQSPVGKPRREPTALLRDGDCEGGGPPGFTDTDLLELQENPSPTPADPLSPCWAKVVGFFSNS